MEKIKIVKKNDVTSPEYRIGDVFDVSGTWYGGVHITGHTGVTVSLDSDEYILLNAVSEREESAEETPCTDAGRPVIREGDIVRHFKRELADARTTDYLYRVLHFATHTETEESLVVYEALYPPFRVCARPAEMFFSKVDTVKYPHIRQKYRFEPADHEREI